MRAIAHPHVCHGVEAERSQSPLYPRRPVERDPHLAFPLCLHRLELCRYLERLPDRQHAEESIILLEQGYGAVCERGRVGARASRQ
eukprot:scaffold130170_cov26-Tisochrysis_lutea.AAC.1